MRIYLIAIIFCFSACGTKQLVVDTGVADPVFRGNMMQYLRSDPYNWELTVQMIEHAGITDLFEGKVDTMPEITFWAPKSYSILRFLFESQEQGVGGTVYFNVTDIPADLCREFILRHVVKGRHLKKDISYRNMDYSISHPSQDGGTIFETIGNNQLRAFLEGSSYGGVPNAGPVTLSLFSITKNKLIPMATPDIQPDNGVVHALNYNYEFPEI